MKGAAIAGVNSLAATNVHSIAVQVPISELTNDGSVPTTYTASNSTIGVWTTASRQKTKIYSLPQTNTVRGSRSRDWVTPLINEVIIPMGQKDRWNATAPKNDSQFSEYYDHPGLAGLLNVLYPGAFPNLAAYTSVATNTRPDLDAGIAHRRSAAVPRFPEQHRNGQGRHAAPQRCDPAHGHGERQHPGRRRAVTTAASPTDDESLTTWSASSSRPSRAHC